MTRTRRDCALCAARLSRKLRAARRRAETQRSRYRFDAGTGDGFRRLGLHRDARSSAPWPSRDMRVRVAVRRPGLGYKLPLMGDVGQIEVVQANIRNPASIGRALDGAEGCINLVGVLYEAGRQHFLSLHAKGAEEIAAACAARGVSRMVQVSAIGADADSGPSTRAPRPRARRRCAGFCPTRPSFGRRWCSGWTTTSSTALRRWRRSRRSCPCSAAEERVFSRYSWATSRPPSSRPCASLRRRARPSRSAALTSTPIVS